MCNKVTFYSLFTKKSGEKWGNVGENDYLCSQTRIKKYIKEVRMRFLGNIEAKIDVKGRAFLPATFRKVLQAGGEERLVLRKDVFQASLVLYPESVWNEQMDLLRARLNRWNRQEQQVFRQFVSEVELVTLDGNGRFLIPKRYLRMAEIDQDIKFVGMDDTIEIWSSRKVEEQQMKPEDFGNALEQLMMVEQE
jgi:MraZ protein